MRHHNHIMTANALILEKHASGIEHFVLKFVALSANTALGIVTQCGCSRRNSWVKYGMEFLQKKKTNKNFWLIWWAREHWQVKYYSNQEQS